MFPLHEVCKMLSAAMYILDAVTGLQSKAPKLREVQYRKAIHSSGRFSCFLCGRSVVAVVFLVVLFPLRAPCDDALQEPAVDRSLSNSAPPDLLRIR